MEYRLGSDPGANPCLVRLSIGVEDLEVSAYRMSQNLTQLIFILQDLRADLCQALQTLAKVSKSCPLLVFHWPEPM